MEGEAVVKYKDGSKFIGSYKNNTYNGKGKFIFKDG